MKFSPPRIKSIDIGMGETHKLYFRALSAKQHITMQNLFRDATDNDEKCVEDFARMIIMSHCDEAGKLLCTEADLEGIVADNSLATLFTLGNFIISISKPDDDELKKN